MDITEWLMLALGQARNSIQPSLVWMMQGFLHCFIGGEWVMVIGIVLGYLIPHNLKVLKLFAGYAVLFYQLARHIKFIVLATLAIVPLVWFYSCGGQISLGGWSLSTPYANSTSTSSMPTTTTASSPTASLLRQCATTTATIAIATATPTCRSYAIERWSLEIEKNAVLELHSWNAGVHHDDLTRPSKNFAQGATQLIESVEGARFKYETVRREKVVSFLAAVNKGGDGQADLAAAVDSGLEDLGRANDKCEQLCTAVMGSGENSMKSQLDSTMAKTISQLGEEALLRTVYLQSSQPRRGQWPRPLRQEDIQTALARVGEATQTSLLLEKSDNLIVGECCVARELHLMKVDWGKVRDELEQTGSLSASGLENFTSRVLNWPVLPIG